jgi:hypothetical protein
VLRTAVRFSFSFFFFYLPAVCVFYSVFCSGSIRCTAFLGGCCVLVCRGFVCDFQEVKILLFSVVFPNSLRFFSFFFEPDFFFYGLVLALARFFSVCGWVR